MSPAVKRIVRDWLARVDAGVIEAEDFGISFYEVEQLRADVAR